MLKYELGEMKGSDGLSLRYEVEAKAADYARSMFESVSRSPCYEALAKKLPSPKVVSYFRKMIKDEILPVVRQGCVLRYFTDKSAACGSGGDITYAMRSPVMDLLTDVWDIDGITLKLVSTFSFRGISAEFTGKNFRGFVKDMARCIRFALLESPGLGGDLPFPRPAMIACHYAEGADLARRNDFNWYLDSGIPPQRVLVYFDVQTSRPVLKSDIDAVRSMGFECVVLDRGIAKSCGMRQWMAKKISNSKLIDRRLAKNRIDGWIVSRGNDLIRQIYYWREFFDSFNIKVHYIPEEGFLWNIAQAIAHDIGLERSGLLVGKQRSEIFHSYDIYIGHHPKHVFFIWNERTGKYLNNDDEKIDSVIISGYANKVAGDEKHYSRGLRDAGARFVITLFDNVFSKDIHFSRAEMVEFYKAFLELVSEEREIGLIIKPKKPKNIERLSLLEPMIGKAVATGRCVLIRDGLGMLPATASMGSDLAVGIGISSAVVESVMSGCRGVHYDIVGFRKHEFYKWGYERIIFDDLSILLARLKQYVKDPSSIPGFGDWSRYMDKLDAFKDCGGGSRMGQYMQHLLDAFDRCDSRASAIEYANDKYAELWGKDKVRAS